jgi:hypothetical protein
MCEGRMQTVDTRVLLSVCSYINPTFGFLFLILRLKRNIFTFYDVSSFTHGVFVGHPASHSMACAA